MSEALSIERRKSIELDHSFETLRREGIKLAQQMCGELWTDYNLHDPGVTILEQLVYALTDLIYRSDFDVEDFLVNDEGEIDFSRLALHAPEEVFPCRPTTLLDYRKTILNAVNELDNLWIEACDNNSYSGLYRIEIKTDQGLSQQDNARVVEDVIKCYGKNRNLCEDIAEISVVENSDYQLVGQIEIGGGRPSADILAEIYFKCARYVSGGVLVNSYDQALNEGMQLEEVFSGPFTNHGLFSHESFGENQQTILLSNLYLIIGGINAVDHVRGLNLERDGVAYYDSIESGGADGAASMYVPCLDDEIKIMLTTNGRVIPVDIGDVRAKFDEMNFKYHSTRSTPQDISLVYSMPTSERRPMVDYFSIQNQFPSTYGIGRYGVPESAPEAVKASANQLKSYLVIFEQVMANFLANLDSVNNLFSVDTDSQSSYHIKLLKKEEIPGLDAIYPLKPEETLSSVVGKYDNYLERKNRLLDYLLALYGESFCQDSLRHFNCYYNQNEIERAILDNKVEYLKSIVEVGRDRAAASDYSANSWSQRCNSGLQRRASMLLGFKNQTPRALVMAILKQGIKLAKHCAYEQLKAGSPELEFIDIEKIRQGGFEPVPFINVAAQDVAELRKQIGDVIPLKNNLLSDELLRDGIYLDRFRLGSLTLGQDYQLTYRTEEGRYWYLGTFFTKEQGFKAANALRHFLLRLNMESEGLHVLEHIQLRPLGQSSHAGMSMSDKEDFYSFKVSVIFPAWSARCYDIQFRMLAEEIIRANLGAHICPEIYWLDFHKMYEFEMLYEKWMELKAKSESDQGELNYYSMKLISFLFENKASHTVNV